MAPIGLLHAADRKGDSRDETLTKGRPTSADGLLEAIVIKHENLFFVAQRDGNVPFSGSHGLDLYYHDCRYVSGYEMESAGKKPTPLSASSVQGARGVFASTNPQIKSPDGRVIDQEEIGITWRRLVNSEIPALRDRVLFQNFTLRFIELTVALEIQSTFEDVFAVRGLLSKHDPTADGRRHVQRMGRAHLIDEGAGLQCDRVSSRHGLAARQFDHRGGLSPPWLG